MQAERPGISRRAALLAGAALSAIPLGVNRASASDGPTAARRTERKRRPTVWRAKFGNARVERHPNGKEGEYLATFSGGSGSGRCRRTDKVRAVDHAHLSRCIQRDDRDLSGGHVGAVVGGTNYRVLGYDWDGDSGELHMHLHKEKKNWYRASPAGDTESGDTVEPAGDTYVGACSCPFPMDCSWIGDDNPYCPTEGIALL